MSWSRYSLYPSTNTFNQNDPLPWVSADTERASVDYRLLKTQNLKMKQPNLQRRVILHTVGAEKNRLTFLKSFRIKKKKKMAHITASVSHGASTSGDWRESWDVHQTPRANNWLLPTIKINQNVVPKTGAPEWDKWHQLIPKTTCDRPNSSKSRVFWRSARFRWMLLPWFKVKQEFQESRMLWSGCKITLPPSTVNFPDNNICWTIRHYRGHWWQRRSKRTTDPMS